MEAKVKYIVWSKGSSPEILTMGTAQECAVALKMRNDKEFLKTVERVRHGADLGMEIHVSTDDIMCCPCEYCLKSPRERGVVSSSCGMACDKWWRWYRRYWYCLNRKYAPKVRKEVGQ